MPLLRQSCVRELRKELGRTLPELLFRSVPHKLTFKWLFTAIFTAEKL